MTPMQYHVCTCAGVKSCEFFPEEFKVSYTEVDPNGLKWASLLADQE